MPGLPFDHLAIAVPSIEEARSLYERLWGGPCSATETIPGQGVRVAFIGAVELLEPTGPDTPVGRFLAKRGAGLHHVGYQTPNIDVELRRLSDAGFELIDRTARPGAGGHRVAFLHPRSAGGVLVELVERAAPPSAPQHHR
jgi:methylmalonyl-CoA/ethylmalonyl-CoA epimerase